MTLDLTKMDITWRDKHLFAKIASLMYLRFAIFFLLSARFADGLEFDGNINNKTNLCDRYAMYKNGEIGLGEALADLSFSSMSSPSELFIVDENSGAIDPNYPGIIPEILDEISGRGKFSWRNSSDILSKPANMTWTEFLTWSAEKYDFSADGWAVSLERLKSGFQFVELFDQSPIIITMKLDQEQIYLNIWNLMEPFETSVWVCICATIVISAVIYLFLEMLGNIREEQNWYQWVTNGIYHSTLMFTGNMTYQPASLSTKVFVVSFSLWSLFITTAYTANLASFLVIRNTQKVVINNLDDVIKNKWPVCVWSTTGSHMYVEYNYPDAILLPTMEKNDMYQRLRDGTCRVAVIPKDLWKIDETNEEINEDCAFTWVGRAITQLSSGIAIKLDYNEFCSSLIIDVFNLHIKEMTIDGTLDGLKSRAIENSGETVCTENRGNSLSGGDHGGIISFDFNSMSGVFIIHGGFSAVAIALGLLWKLCQQAKKNVQNTKEFCCRSESQEEESVIHLEGEDEEGTVNLHCLVDEKNRREILEKLDRIEQGKHCLVEKNRDILEKLERIEQIMETNAASSSGDKTSHQ